MKEISIPRAILDEMITHCRETVPNEACGILAGKTDIVEKAYRISNIKKSAFNYEMNSREQFECEKEIKAMGLRIVGIYHSHPASDAYPSPLDVLRVYWPGDTETQIFPDACYVIIGPVDGEIETKAFTVGPEQKINELQLNIT